MRKFRLATALFVLTLAAAFALTGCGDSESTESGDAEGGLDHLTVQSLWLPQG